MTIEIKNTFKKQGKRQIWRYPGQGCAYLCLFHKGKVEWHHPISTVWHCGFYLCEAHHSILMGRKKLYSGEICLEKSLEQTRKEIRQMEVEVVTRDGFPPEHIDKR